METTGSYFGQGWKHLMAVRRFKRIIARLSDKEKEIILTELLNLR